MLRSRAIRRASGDAFSRPSAREGSCGASMRSAGRGSGFGASALFSAFAARLLSDGYLLALLADDRDPLADLDLLALAGEDLQQDAARVGFDLLGDLVRVELVERLALLDRVPFRLEPADDRAGLHALPEPREAHISSQVVPLL